MMADIDFTKVMMDDSTLDVSKEVAMVMSIANTLRGPYHADKYKDVIIPMIIIRRLECALQIKDSLGKTKQEKVAEAFAKNPKTPQQVLEHLSGYPFYNTSTFTLKNLLNEAPAIVENLNYYIDSFSPNIRDILTEKLQFKDEIKKLDKNNRLLGVVKKFSELDLNPETIDGHKMGYMFEEIIRRFSENAEAGDHYTPREVIRMLTSILLAEGTSDLFGEGNVEHSGEEVEAKPEVAIKKPKPASVEEKQKKALSEIIEELNALYDKSYEPDATTKTAQQIKDYMLKIPVIRERLEKSAKINSYEDFKFTYDDCVQEALVLGFDQNVDFYTLLLENQTVRDKIARIFQREIYNLLHGSQKSSQNGATVISYGDVNTPDQRIAEGPLTYGISKDGKYE